MYIGKRVKLILLFAFLLFSVFIYKSPAAFAATSTCIADCPPPVLLDIGNVIPSIINTILTVAIVIFFIMIIVQGFSFVTAGGDPEKLAAAKKSFIFSIIGFVLVFIPFIVIPLIGKITGIATPFSSGNGNLQVNIQSTFTPTPLPSYLINTETPVPTRLGSGCGKVADYPGCFWKISEWYYPTEGSGAQFEYGPDLTGNTTYDYNVMVNNCVPTALTMNMNAYITYLTGKRDAIRIYMAMDELQSQHQYTPGQGSNTDLGVSMWTNIANNISKRAGLTITWNANQILFINGYDYTDLDTMLARGYPVLTTLGAYVAGNKVGGHEVVVIGHKNGLIYVANPGNSTQAYIPEATWESYKPQEYVLLKPSSLP